MDYIMRWDLERVNLDNRPPLQNFKGPDRMPQSDSRVYKNPLEWKTVQPWPSAMEPAGALGYLPPFDEEHALRGGDEYAAIGWQDHWRAPWWANKEVQAFAKQHEFNLRFQTPQSRMHELNQFSPAFVAQPPQTLYEIPDYPY